MRNGRARLEVSRGDNVLPISTPEEFASRVLETYRSRSGPLMFAKTASESVAPMGVPFGHPLFETIGVGEQRRLSMVSAHLDLAAFTARTFWEDLGDVTDLALAVLTQVAFTVQSFGGHVLGLRGDGLFAGWGGINSDPAVDTTLALAGCAFALDATRGALNGLLERSGIDPVRMKAGVDQGEVMFVRVGGRVQSEVNVVGFSANFASKCEKTANSWEIVAGEGACRWIAPEYLSRHPLSPKTYTRGAERRHYAFSTFAWERRELLRAMAGIPEELNGHDTSAVVQEGRAAWASSR